MYSLNLQIIIFMNLLKVLSNAKKWDRQELKKKDLHRYDCQSLPKRLRFKIRTELEHGILTNVVTKCSLKKLYQKKCKKKDHRKEQTRENDTSEEIYFENAWKWGWNAEK